MSELKQIQNSRNIEIKAKIADHGDTIAKVRQISDEKDGQVIKQTDIYYNVSHGRLKLRKFTDGTSNLIFYNRPDLEGPKLCEYNKCVLQAAQTESIEGLLSNAHGIRGIVFKTRLLYMVGQTRVHIDQVDGLGSFVELEVVLTTDQTAQDGQQIAEDLMEKIAVLPEDLITVSYIDLIASKTNK